MPKSPNHISVTLAILNYNGITHLRRFMPSLIDLHSAPYKLLIIDNASEDESIEYLNKSYPQVPLVKLSKNYGFAEGYNRGLKDVNTTYTFILNNDVEIKRKDIDILYNFLRSKPEYGAVQPKILALERPREFEYAGAAGGFIDFLGYPFCRGRILNHIEEDHGQYDEPADIFWATGAALMIKTDVFKSLGGFESSFFAHQEEIDLCWRIQRAGLKIRVLPSSVAMHLGGGTLTYENPFKTFLNFRNNLVMLIRNMPLANLVYLLPLRVVLDMVAMLNYAIQGNFKSSYSVIKAQFAVYTRIFTHLSSRRRANKKVALLRKSKEVNISGILKTSILFQYYILGKNRFNEIVK